MAGENDKNKLCIAQQLLRGVFELTNKDKAHRYHAIFMPHIVNIGIDIRFSKKRKECLPYFMKLKGGKRNYYSVFKNSDDLLAAEITDETIVENVKC